MIIKNCPALEDIPELTDDVDPYGNRIYKIDTPDYCCKYKKQCKNIDDCIIKSAIRNKTTAMFEVKE